jgi:signal transduction histidine kinase
MKLTLLRKVLLLVSIPLCFEITIFGFLIYLQDQVQRETQRINRNKKINDMVNLILSDGIQLSDNIQLDSYQFLNASSINKKVAACVADVYSRFEELKVLAHDDPAVLKDVESCQGSMNLLVQDVADLKQKIQSASFDELPNLIRKAKNQLDLHLAVAYRSGLFELAEKSLRASDDGPSKQMREAIRTVLKGALVVSALLALSGATMLSKYLVGRLSHLANNANRLAEGKPLLAAIGGTDEVAELERNFHYAAELIEAAKRMRQEVTAMITHDLKTPLQSVRSYLEMMEHGLFGPLNEQGLKLLSTTQNATEHMVGLIDNVLQLEKLRSGNVKLQATSIKLAPLLNTCLDSVNLLAAEKDIVIAANYQSSSDNVDGDAFWLEQVFVNILSNAIKFTPNNSTVSISTHSANGDVEIRIADQGPGIPDKDKKLIFDRFHRVESTSTVAGTGLGLPIARELIELHHGSISVASEVGKGSTFAIKLPLSKAPRNSRGGWIE